MRQALTEAFGTSRELDRFLVEHDFKRLEYFSAAGNLKDHVFDLIEELSKEGKLGKLMVAVLEERSDYTALQDLESRLGDWPNVGNRDLYPKTIQPEAVVATPSGAGSYGKRADDRNLVPKTVRSEGVITAPAGTSSYGKRGAESTRTEDQARGIWMIPYGRNPYFTGREDALSALHEALHGDGCAVVGQTQAISGLGGIGKTQTAVEYAYRHRLDYQTVLWIRGATEGDLTAGFWEIAQELFLDIVDIEQGLAAVHRWMDESTSWLLVVDNADYPDLLKPYLPLTHKGHILLTSRASYFGSLSIPCPLRLDTLPPEEAQAFLLARCKTPDLAQQKAAKELSQELGFLPLALEQASAYIAAKHTLFEDYLSAYREFRIRLLERSKPETGSYPHGVETTWTQNFEKVERISQASGDVLRLSAFLSPERIPEELLFEGAGELGPAISQALETSDRLHLNELLEPLTFYSLIELNSQDRSYSVHPLVQDVVMANLDQGSRKSWEERVVRSLDLTFPGEVHFRNRKRCFRLLPHVEAQSLESLESARVLRRAALYLHSHSSYDEAESLFQRSLEIAEKALGGDHPEIATILDNLALLNLDQGRCEEAEPLYQRSLEIHEKGDHPYIASTLGNLAEVYRAQGRDAEAAKLTARAESIRKKK